MRVLSVGAEWLSVRSGGLNRYTFGLAHAMADLGVQQRWIVMGTGEVEADGRISVRSIAPPHTSLRQRYQAVVREFATGLKESPDVVASHFALYAFPVRKSLGEVPHVVHFHGPWAAEARAEGAPRWKTWLQIRRERAVYATADRLITLSRAFARIAIDDYGVPESRVRVVPGGIDAGRFAVRASRNVAREELGLPLDRLIVCCVRRLARRMGLEVLVESMEKVVKAHPDALLLIAGKGALELELKQQIKDRGLTGNVQLLGFVPDEQLPLLYRASEVSIVPTQSLEGFGLITLESLAAGTPVLVTPVGGLPEAVGGLSEGLVLADTSAWAIAQGLIGALSGSLPLPSSQECTAYVRTNYDWPIIARRVLEVYQEAIDAHGG